MPKESKVDDIMEDIIDVLHDDDATLMVIYSKENGDRGYIHKFDSSVSALEFIEIMASGLRSDLLETALKRSLN